MMRGLGGRLSVYRCHRWCGGYSARTPHGAARDERPGCPVRKQCRQPTSGQKRANNDPTHRRQISTVENARVDCQIPGVGDV